MRVLFLDVDGVLNSYQSAHFWHNKRDQSKWENEGFAAWAGTLREYLTQEFDPIALSNLEEILREAPDLQIVVSSTWRLGETVESLKKIFAISPLVASRILSKTPRFGGEQRGKEIQDWLDRHPTTTDFVIVDDDSDMLHLKKHLFQTSAKVGLDWYLQEKISRYLKASPSQKRLIRFRKQLFYCYRSLRYRILSRILGRDLYWKIYY